MSTFDFFQPTRIVFGARSLERLPGLLPLAQPTRVALMCGRRSARSSGLLDRIVGLLAGPGLVVEVLSGIPPEPFSDDVDAFATSLREFEAECVVAFGGGSVMDLAKFAAYLVCHEGTCAAFDGGPAPRGPGLPLILIPTTAGTGSEVTPYSVINNRRNGKKFTVNSPHFFPRVALVDPSLTRTVPPDHRLATGLDAWVHCLEAYLTARPHPMVDPWAKAGLSLVSEHLPIVLEQPQDERGQEALALAALYGGLAIAHSRTGLVHTLSVALAKYAALPHGLLNAVITPHVLAFNLAACDADRLATLSAGGATPEQIINTVRTWLARLGVPTRVTLDHYDENLKDALVERVRMDGGLPGVNPRPIEDHHLRRLLDRIVTTEG